MTVTQNGALAYTSNLIDVIQRAFQRFGGTTQYGLPRIQTFVPWTFAIWSILVSNLLEGVNSEGSSDFMGEIGLERWYHSFVSYDQSKK